MEIVNYAKARGLPVQVLIKCDANSHHLCWGRSDINPRGRSLLEYLLVKDLLVFKQGNVPIFLAANREEVIDITVTIYHYHYIVTITI